MESSTFDGGDFQLHLHSHAVTGDSPTMIPPMLQLYFDFASFSNCFLPPVWRALRDRDAWQQEVEQMLLTVLHRGGRGWSFDVPRLAAAYCQFFDGVIRCFLVPHVRYIVVNAVITDAARPSPPPTDGLHVPGWPDVELVDDVMVLEEVEDSAQGGEASGDSPASAAALLQSVKVDVFGEGEAEKAYADVSCSICLSDFEAGEQLSVMPCHHRFHGKCLLEWLGRSHVCPLCKFVLPPAVPVERNN